MKRLAFIVLGCPVPKQRHRSTKGGRAYTPAKTRAYEKLVHGLALAAVAARSGWPVRPACKRPKRCDCRWCSTEYVVALDVYMPDKRTRDLDNVAKSVLDGCNGAVWRDDRQVGEIHIRRHLDRVNPRVEVVIGGLE